MILERIDVHELRAHSIGQAQPVAGRTVVIAGRESLNVEPAYPACRQNNGLGCYNNVALVVEVLEYRSGAGPIVVAHQLDRGTKLK